MTDLINGLFEISGGFFILPSIIKTYRNKSTGGINYLTNIFFTTWGLWNVYFYSHHDFSLSFYGGLFLSVTNIIWLTLILKYKS